MLALRLQFEIMLVLEDPGHDEVKEHWRAKANKTKVDETQSDFVGANAEAPGPPFTDAKRLELKEENNFLKQASHGFKQKGVFRRLFFIILEVV